MSKGSHVKYLLFLPDIKKKNCIFWAEFSKYHKMSHFIKIHPVEA